MSAAVTYSSYLELETVLGAQCPRSKGADGKPEHDEMLFIIVHQVYELWFKQMLHELDYLSDCLRRNDSAHALHTFRRMLTILKTLVSQIDVLETMTPLEFNAFRAFLDTASGFQSAQFRELEFALGHKRPRLIDLFVADPPAADRLRARYRRPTLWDAFLHFIAANNYDLPAAELQRDVTEPVGESSAVQQVLIDIYRNDPALIRICERLVDLDEGIQEWRYRHVQMVARTIGSKRGTGGSAGVEYLASTIRPLFPDLWAIRTEL